MIKGINKENSALIVVDVINSCSAEQCEIRKWEITFKKIREMIPRLNDFINEYKKIGGKVIYVNCVPWTKKYLAKNIIELYKDPKCKYYSKDKKGFSEKFNLVKPDKEDIIITKNSYDAFTNPKLEMILKKQKIKYLLVTGIFGDGCVDSTIQGGFSKGFNFIILKDLIETTDVKIRQDLQKLLKKFTWPVMFGETIDSKDFLREIKK